MLLNVLLNIFKYLSITKNTVTNTATPQKDFPNIQTFNNMLLDVKRPMFFKTYGLTSVLCHGMLPAPHRSNHSFGLFFELPSASDSAAIPLLHKSLSITNLKLTKENILPKISSGTP